MTFAEHLEAVRAIRRRLDDFRSLEGLFRYDQWTSLPRSGAAWRQELAGRLAEDKAALLASPGSRAAAAYFSAMPPEEIEDEVDRAQVRIFLSEYRKTAGVPSE
ncbi:MAG: hypothetical protein J6H20_04920, partial [Pyramidobacter sp.]|nr:hypothetical protein [Pyramidobacter sp.]